jgi:hypothetical protein
MNVDILLNRDSYFPGDLLFATLQLKATNLVSTPKKRGSLNQQNMIEWIVLQTVGILNFDTKYIKLPEKLKEKNNIQQSGMSFRSWIDSLGLIFFIIIFSWR